jgi:hypothetical protein
MKNSLKAIYSVLFALALTSGIARAQDALDETVPRTLRFDAANSSGGPCPCSIQVSHYTDLATLRVTYSVETRRNDAPCSQERASYTSARFDLTNANFEDNPRNDPHWFVLKLWLREEGAHQFRAGFYCRYREP